MMRSSPRPCMTPTPMKGSEATTRADLLPPMMTTKTMLRITGGLPASLKALHLQVILRKFSGPIHIEELRRRR